MKTYHDQLPYDDDDAPSSNQGFHCGALLAAKELGFPVTDEDIERVIAGYRRMFNDQGGYFATSLKQQDHVGQDSLYGEVLTSAVFGRRLLPNDMVRRHLETSVRIQTPYGMRVISKPDGLAGRPQRHLRVRGLLVSQRRGQLPGRIDPRHGSEVG